MSIPYNVFSALNSQQQLMMVQNVKQTNIQPEETVQKKNKRVQKRSKKTLYKNAE